MSNENSGIGVDYKALCRVQDIAPGQVVAFRIGNNRIAVANVNGSFYAFDDACTHAACPLSEGTLTANILRCRCHSSQFDVITGEVIAEPAEDPLIIHNVRVVGGTVEIGT